MSQSTTLYNDYKTATNDASSIKSKVETMSMISPIAFALGGLSAVEFIIQSGKLSKAKKLTMSLIYLNKGAGMSLALNF